MPDNRKFTLIALVCVILVVLALIANTPRLPEKLANLNMSGNPVVSLSPSDSFYEPDPTPTLTLGAKIASLIKTAPPAKNQTEDPKRISAKSYLVGNILTGKILLTHNPDLVLPVASMSKLITAMEAIDKMSLDQRITITEAVSSVPYGGNFFEEGETLTVEELLYPLLLSSSNIAAEALASTTNRTRFLETMSSYAWEIGMSQTFFADPSGLSPTNISTARDFFALARYLHESRPEILSITKTKNYTLATTTDHGRHEFVNIHPFARDPNFLGGKTGHTDVARDTMLTIMNIAGQPVAIIVLGSENRQRDTLLLIEKMGR